VDSGGWIAGQVSMVESWTRGHQRVSHCLSIYVHHWLMGGGIGTEKLYRECSKAGQLIGTRVCTINSPIECSKLEAHGLLVRRE